MSSGDNEDFDPSARTLDGGEAPPPPPVDRDAQTLDGGQAPPPPPVDRSARTLDGGQAPPPPPVSRDAQTLDGGEAPAPPPVSRDAQTFAEGIPLPPAVDRDAQTFAGGIPLPPMDPSAPTLLGPAPPALGGPQPPEPPLASVDPDGHTLVGPPPSERDLESSLAQSGPLKLPDFPAQDATFTDGADPRSARTLSESTASSHPHAYDSRAPGFGSQPEAWTLSGSQPGTQPGEQTIPDTKKYPPPGGPPGQQAPSQAQGATRAEGATRADPSQPHGSAGPGDTQVEPRSGLEQSAGSGLIQSQATVPRGKPGSAIPSRLGPYRLLRALGAGGMGAVYEAAHVRTDRKVALKVLRAPPGAHTGVERFHIEGRAAGRLRHPNLVSVLDLDRDERSDLWYMAMDLVEGETLHELVEREGPLDDQRAVEIGLALADALGYAHTQKVLHRDVKPHNVMLDREGTVRLTDFGLAKLLEEPGQALTQGFTLLGTPGYMPPEQAGMAAPVNEQADVYGLGATLYYALTGKPPFTGKTVGAIINQVLSKNPEALRKTRPEIATDLETIVLHCLEKEGEHRYPGMPELAEDLRRFQASTAIVAQRPSGPEQLRRWARRNPRQAGIGALGLVVVLMGVTYGALAFFTRAQHQRQIAEQEQKVKDKEQEVKDKEQEVKDKEQEVIEEQETLDKIAPTIELRSPRQPADGSPLRTRAERLEVVLRVQDTDVTEVTLDGVALSVDPDEPEVYRGAWTLEGEGRHQAELAASDEAGNVTTQLLVAVRDVRPPRVEVTIVPTAWPEGDPDAVTEVDVQVTIHDEEQPAAEVVLSKQGKLLEAKPEVVGRTWRWSGIELGVTGEFTFAARATDDVGNQGAGEARITRAKRKVVEATWWNATVSQKNFAKAKNLPLTRTVDGIDFVLIPPGVYTRGASESDPFFNPKHNDARPHVVKLTKGLYVSAWEVDQAHYRKLVPDYQAPDYTPQEGRAGLDEPPTLSMAGQALPVVGVTRDEATAWCVRFAEAAGIPGRVRLPTEAEWEYACRAETTGPWFWGGSTWKAKQHANVKDDLFQAEYAPKLRGRGQEFFACDDGHALLAAVGREGVEPNPFGLYDTIGNAAEWVIDGFDYYPLDRTTELTDPPPSEGRGTIHRGGSFCTQLVFARASSRNAYNDRSYPDVGFRIVIELDE